LVIFVSNGLAPCADAALLHHITTDLLKRSYLALARDAAPGIDGVTWQAYTRRPSHRAPLAYRLQAERLRPSGFALAIKNLLTNPT
jgi:hypothetical protein